MRDVRAVEEGKKHLAAFRLRQVERQPALAPVHAEEIGRVALVVALQKRRPPVAHLVALRRLDLDDLGAVVGEDLRRVGPAQDAG